VTRRRGERRGRAVVVRVPGGGDSAGCRFARFCRTSGGHPPVSCRLVPRAAASEAIVGHYAAVAAEMPPWRTARSSAQWPGEVSP